MYRDPNHKPELALALTDFDCLCGFRPAHEIAAFLHDVPEFAALVGADAARAFTAATSTTTSAALSDEQCATAKAALQALFRAVYAASPECVERTTAALAQRCRAATEAPLRGIDKPLRQLILSTHGHFPNDVGLFALFLLNRLLLRPGEAIFLGANEPHAYLAGDCVECMACSDNVVRAGLTPKLKDVDTLCAMLTYRAGAPEVLRGERLDAHDSVRVVYAPPIKDFCLEKFDLPAGQR